MGKNRKINISIIVISGLITFIQTLIISISAFADGVSIYQNLIFQIVIAVLSSVVVSLEGVQMNLKRIKSRRSSINSIPRIEDSATHISVEIEDQK